MKELSAWLIPVCDRKGKWRLAPTAYKGEGAVKNAIKMTARWKKDAVFYGTPIKVTISQWHRGRMGG